VTVILVTGRILDDLRRVAGDLSFVDAVVAENLALVHFPGSRTSGKWIIGTCRVGWTLVHYRPLP